MHDDFDHEDGYSTNVTSRYDEAYAGFQCLATDDNKTFKWPLEPNDLVLLATSL